VTGITKVIVARGILCMKYGHKENKKTSTKLRF